MNFTDKYIWIKKIDISAFTAGDTHSITLREPSNGEYKSINALQKSMSGATDDPDGLFDALEKFCDLLCTVIIDHDFYDGDKKLPSKDVAAFINGSSTLTQFIIEEYITSLPLFQKNAKK